MSEPDYVTQEAWLRPGGRPDAIDEVADQFERRAPGAEAFWTADTVVAWPRHPRAWGHPSRTAERRAG